MTSFPELTEVAPCLPCPSTGHRDGGRFSTFGRFRRMGRVFSQELHPLSFLDFIPDLFSSQGHFLSFPLEDSSEENWGHPHVPRSHFLKFCLRTSERNDRNSPQLSADFFSLTLSQLSYSGPLECGPLSRMGGVALGESPHLFGPLFFHL